MSTETQLSATEQLIDKVLSNGLTIEKDFGDLLKIQEWPERYGSFSAMWAERFKGTTVSAMLMPLFGAAIIEHMLADDVAVEDIADVLPGYTTATVEGTREQLEDGTPASEVKKRAAKKTQPENDPSNGVPFTFLNGARRGEFEVLAKRLKWTLKKTVEKALDDYLDKMNEVLDDVADDIDGAEDE